MAENDNKKQDVPKSDPQQELQKQLIFMDSLQKQLQAILEQKQYLNLEGIQLNAALAEIEKAEGKLFKIVGPILVEAEPKKLVEDLTERRGKNAETSERLKKQEEMIRSKLTETQKKLEAQFSKQKSA